MLDKCTYRNFSFSLSLCTRYQTDDVVLPVVQSFADITVSQPNKKTDAASYPKAHPASHKTTDTTSHPPPDATSHSKANPASNKTTDKASDSQADTTSREQAHPFPDEPTYTEAR